MMPIDRAGRARFCDSCERPVYDSKALTRDELLDLIAQHEDQRLPCMRLHRRPDGTIVTRDCFAPFVRVGRFLWLKVGVAAVAFWASALGLRELAKSINEYAVDRTVSTVRGGMVVLRARPDPVRLASRANVARLNEVSLRYKDVSIRTEKRLGFRARSSATAKPVVRRWVEGF